MKKKAIKDTSAPEVQKAEEVHLADSFWVAMVCETCGVSFLKKRSHIRQSQRRGQKVRYCSVKCVKKEGKMNPGWCGDSIIVGRYRYVYDPCHPNATKDGYVSEHRRVFEQHLGRYLLNTEVVHHKNKDRLDNRLENLELASSNGRHFIDHHLQKRDFNGRFLLTK